VQDKDETTRSSEFDLQRENLSRLITSEASDRDVEAMTSMCFFVKSTENATRRP